jgi:hypothetical protein
MKKLIKDILPNPILDQLKTLRSDETKIKMFERLGYNVSRVEDYYSPLPTYSTIKKNQPRWDKPSSMAGIKYDIASFQSHLTDLISKYGEEFKALPSYQEHRSIGFGPGYTEVDAFVQYMMIRNSKPSRYIEVGSGLSTYYCSLAAKRNQQEGSSLKIKCIEPYPYNKLYTIENIEVVKDEIQNIDKNIFLELEVNDILFIDSTHVVKIDGDVPFLFLEVLPILKKGTLIHIHDIPFPFNTPYPSEYWITGKNWPKYWNEAMLLQAFLMFNDSFEIIQSTPMIRYYNEQFLKDNIPFYKTVKEEPNTFSSIWLKKVK